MSGQASKAEACYCPQLPDLAVVPMGGEGLDERVLGTLERAKEHGGHRWWLYTSFCTQCGQFWMIAQDDRIYDNFYLRRLAPSAAEAIVEEARWPDELLTYEQVLRLGRTMSTPWTFLDPRSPALVQTAEDLRRERPGISVEEIADLLAITVRDASRLFSKPGLIDRILIRLRGP